MSKEVSSLPSCSFDEGHDGFIQLHAESTARLKAALDCHHLDVIDLFRALAEWDAATIKLASRVKKMRHARFHDVSRQAGGKS